MAARSADPAPANDAGPDLVYALDTEPGIRRRRSGRGFRYIDPDGKAVRDTKALQRIRGLAIPPAWTDVWIAPDPRGHLQASGRDGRGRKQYRYHPAYRAQREAHKFAHMLAFVRALPQIRAKVDRHLALPGLPREKLLATVVRLLETTMIRVGNADYARTNRSYGLTTLRDRHAAIAGSEVRFSFRGKSGRQWRVSCRDRRVAKVVKASQDLPGQQLFQYVDEDGETRGISSGDVNAYLRGISGQDITAKDFRTWSGTVLAALALRELEEAGDSGTARRNVREAIEAVATQLGNTPTICRKCYVHPEIVDSYLAGQLVLEAPRQVDAAIATGASRLRDEEAMVLAFLEQRLKAAKRAVRRKRARG